MAGSQKSLFGADERPPWEIDDETERLVGTVVFAGPPEGEFDYLVPDNLRGEVHVGRRVRVPLGRGNRWAEGYLIRLENRRQISRRLKPIGVLIDDRNLVSPAMIRLTQWMADYYLCPLGQVLEAVVPAGVRGQAGTRTTRFIYLPDEVRSKLDTLKLPPKQKRVIRLVAETPEAISAADLAKAAGCTQAPINGLLAKGLLESRRGRLRKLQVETPTVQRQQNLTLNPDQQRALEAILGTLHSGRHRTHLLRGVTGSGKTEVYMQAIQEMVHFGRQAIVLVPEISLTPQTVERFRSRFDQVAVLHSHLSDAERHWHWEQIAQGNVPVVVGARSAVFAPTPRLGLIVIDEEHENSFKQDSPPRYHARDVAIQRARAENIPLVLGSATPALESWHRAQTGEYELLELPHRVMSRAMPGVQTIDLRSQVRGRAYTGALSRQLVVQMREVLADGGQVILLLNRRGFSTHIQCPACGHVVRCPSCEIPLTWHRHDDVALCHYCDHQTPTLIECPECRFRGIKYAGLGTQKLEAEVRARFPEHTALRMDTDTMHSPGSHERALSRFREGEVQILLGTQMIAKGLDFPNVMLVGVVNADMALHLPDFRAAERTFQLLVQVAGRTGRGDRGGRVLVQTFSPDHPAIQAAARHDFLTFAGSELPIRETFGYPPYGSIIRAVIRGPQENSTREFAEHLVERIRSALPPEAAKVRILGPAPAPIPKLRDKYRFNVQVQGPDIETLRIAVRAAFDGLKGSEGMDWMVDVDPMSMM